MSIEQRRKNNLAHTRKARGLRAKEIAKAVGISLSAYKNYETGRRFPRPEIAKRIASLLGVSVDWLFFCPVVDDLSSSQQYSLQDSHKEGAQNDNSRSQ